MRFDRIYQQLLICTLLRRQLLLWVMIRCECICAVDLVTLESGMFIPPVALF